MVFVNVFDPHHHVVVALRGVPLDEGDGRVRAHSQLGTMITDPPPLAEAKRSGQPLNRLPYVTVCQYRNENLTRHASIGQQEELPRPILD
jgi:hypothetical protein